MSDKYWFVRIDKKLQIITREDTPRSITVELPKELLVGKNLSEFAEEKYNELL